MTALQPKRRPAPRGAPEERAAALRDQLLVELGKHSRTTKQLADIMELDRQVVYRSLLSLESRGEVVSFNDRRTAVTGTPGHVWSLAGERSPPPPRDPLLWALFGTPP